MKRIGRVFASVLLLAGLAGILLTGCSFGKPTVKLNDYVVVTCEGYDGYGTIYASVDYSQIVEDYADRLSEDLDSELFGSKTPEIAAEFAFNYYEPFALAYKSPDNAKNGDKIKFSWNTSERGIEKLQEVLDVNFDFEDLTYKVKDLKSLEKVDPFEQVNQNYFGISGNATPSGYGTAVVNINDSEITFDLELDTDQTVQNGDTIKVAIDVNEDEADSLARNYGIILSRTEAEILVDGLPYYAQKNPKEIFDCITAESFSHAEKAMLDNYKDYIGQITVSYVGAVYYYADTLDFESYQSNPNNQLVLVYHVDNGVYPGGWYSYVAPNADVLIKYIKNEDGSTTKSVVTEDLYISYDALSDKLGNYFYEYITYWDGPEIATHFIYEDLYYEGHKTLEETISAIETNLIKGQENIYGQKIEKRYNNVIASESLQEYFK